MYLGMIYLCIYTAWSLVELCESMLYILLTFVKFLIFSFKKLFWPHRLSLFYQHLPKNQCQILSPHPTNQCSLFFTIFSLHVSANAGVHYCVACFRDFFHSLIFQFTNLLVFFFFHLRQIYSIGILILVKLSHLELVLFVIDSSFLITFFIFSSIIVNILISYFHLQV